MSDTRAIICLAVIALAGCVARDGCEYLRADRGLTPRMQADGKQVCRKQP